MLKKLNLFCLTGLITLVLLMWKWMGLFLRNNHILRCWGCLFSSDLDWSSYIICIAKTVSKKIRPKICSGTFLSHEVALYLHKSTIQHCINTVAMSWLVVLVATWNCWISYKNGIAGLLVFLLLPLLNPWLIVEI